MKGKRKKEKHMVIPMEKTPPVKGQKAYYLERNNFCCIE